MKNIFYYLSFIYIFWNIYIFYDLKKKYYEKIDLINIFFLLNKLYIIVIFARRRDMIYLPINDYI